MTLSLCQSDLGCKAGLLLERKICIAQQEKGRPLKGSLFQNLNGDVFNPGGL